MGEAAASEEIRSGCCSLPVIGAWACQQVLDDWQLVWVVWALWAIASMLRPVQPLADHCRGWGGKQKGRLVG